ncbi:MAG: undecaprenyl-phosphate galactose phosphotransferase WbaP [Schlesneria sp.]|nr:undecaprenyl-phosphate galactose phosphotransferase WbaP [Schlesneria sp.]
MTSQALFAETTHESVLAENVVECGSGVWDTSNHMSLRSTGRGFSYIFQISKTAFPLWLSDMLAVGVSVGLAWTLLSLAGIPVSNVRWINLASWCLAMTAGCAISGLYPGIGMNSVTELRLISRLVGGIVVLCMGYDLLHGGANQYVMMWPLQGLLLAPMAPTARAAVRRIVCHYDWWGMRTIIVGAGARGLDIMNRLQRKPSLGLKPVGMVDQYRAGWISNDTGLPTGGVFPLEETPKLSQVRHAYYAIFVGSEFPIEERCNLIDSMATVFTQLYITMDSADAGRQWSGALDLGNIGLVKVTERLLTPGGRAIKRAMDIVAILLASPLVVPLVFGLALLVRSTSRGPAFYRSPRIGKDGRTIRIWKLRSMIPNADRLLEKYLSDNPHLRRDWESLHKLPNDPRITWIGRILRKTSLDELPQLWNVFCGDLSLVGPRPILPDQVDKYREIFPLYIRVTPGITGLWQVSGRSSTTHDARLSYDAEYVRNWSLCLDLAILARTIRVVATCEGAC